MPVLEAGSRSQANAAPAERRHTRLVFLVTRITLRRTSPITSTRTALIPASVGIAGPDGVKGMPQTGALIRKAVTQGETDGGTKRGTTCRLAPPSATKGRVGTLGEVRIEKGLASLPPPRIVLTADGQKGCLA